MLHDYGRKIINAIFKKRADSTAVRIELESKVQADSDRRDIRVFEIGLSAEQYGDYEQSTGVAAQEAESKRLITITNVLSDGQRLYFIDPIIKFKRPATLVLEYYYELLK